MNPIVAINRSFILTRYSQYHLVHTGLVGIFGPLYIWWNNNQTLPVIDLACGAFQYRPPKNDDPQTVCRHLPRPDAGGYFVPLHAGLAAIDDWMGRPPSSRQPYQYRVVIDGDGRVESSFLEPRAYAAWLLDQGHLTERVANGDMRIAMTYSRPTGGEERADVRAVAYALMSRSHY